MSLCQSPASLRGLRAGSPTVLRVLCLVRVCSVRGDPSPLKAKVPLEMQEQRCCVSVLEPSVQRCATAAAGGRPDLVPSFQRQSLLSVALETDHHIVSVKELLF